MTTTWTVTRSDHRGEQIIIGASASPDHARRWLFAAAAALIGRAGADERPRYTLHVGEELIAIIQTGDDEHGRPDHAATAEVLSCVQHTRNPFYQDYIIDQGWVMGTTIVEIQPTGVAFWIRAAKVTRVS